MKKNFKKIDFIELKDSEMKLIAGGAKCDGCDVLKTLDEPGYGGSHYAGACSVFLNNNTRYCDGGCLRPNPNGWGDQYGTCKMILYGTACGCEY